MEIMILLQRKTAFNRYNKHYLYGIINEDRGVFKIIQAMEKLPENYQSYILGFGDENISRLFRRNRAIE